MVLRILAAVTLAGLCLAGEARADEGLAVHPLLRSPNKARLAAFLQREIDWEDQGESFSLSGNYRASHTDAKAECRGDWQVSSAAIDTHLTCKPFDERTPVADGDNGFSLQVSLVGDDVLVFNPWGSERHAFECVPHACRFVKAPVLVELIPGASDKKLHDALRALLQKADPDQGYLLFQGSQAKEARVETEVYFANGHEAEAKEVAKLLAPASGPVKVKAWPGSWDYDVVVVAGQRAASGGPEGGGQSATFNPGAR